MSQPLWFLRHENRVIGPFPPPQIREFLRIGEITQDWEISLNEKDWLTIRDSKQFPDEKAENPDKRNTENVAWRSEREQARQRWLNEGQDIGQAQVHDLELERRTRQALVEHQHKTEAMLQQETKRRPPVIAGLLAILVLLGAIYAIWQGQQNEPAITAGISLKANCTEGPAEAVNWSGCDKRGLSVPGALARNMRMEGTNLEGANLAGADFSYGAMARVNLRNASLAGIRLIGVDLTGADLSGADLSYADLSYAVLKDAHLEGVRLDGARLDKATWPDGRICPEGAVGECP